MACLATKNHSNYFPVLLWTAFDGVWAVYWSKNALNAVSTRSDLEVSPEPKITWMLVEKWSSWLENSVSDAQNEIFWLSCISWHQVSWDLQNIHRARSSLVHKTVTEFENSTLIILMVFRFWVVKIGPIIMKTKFFSNHVYLDTRFSGIYKTFTELWALWCTKL